MWIRESCHVSMTLKWVSHRFQNSLLFSVARLSYPSVIILICSKFPIRSKFQVILLGLLMKLGLKVSKKIVNRASGTREEIVFAVVDLEKSDRYPQNFVCLLPKYISRERTYSNRLAQIYGEKVEQIAVKLLSDALAKQTDAEVRCEIEKRLQALKPKPKEKVACGVCGNIFEARKFGYYVQKICPSCSGK